MKATEIAGIVWPGRGGRATVGGTAISRRPASLRQKYDVVFYTPWIGSILSSNGLPPGGAEIQILMLAQALVKRGLRVAIIAFGKPTELPAEINGVTISPRPTKRQHRLVGKVTEAFLIWRALWKTPSQTIVYRAMGVELGLIGIYSRLARRRLIFSSANIVDFKAPHDLLPRRHDLLLYRLGIRLADAVVVQTEEQIPLCETAFGRTPILIKSLEPLAQPHDLPPEAFLWVGRLVSYKRPLEYINLARALPQAKFWMVCVPTPHVSGDQPLVDAVWRESRSLPNLELLPPRPHDEVQSLMRHAIASVNTADYEGMPNVLLEAWSRGVPALVLTHDPGGVVERHRLGAFARGSTDRLVELAREQWRTRDDRQSVSAHCRAYIRVHHAPEVIASQWAELMCPASVKCLQRSEADRICAA